jgi:hypothetical protein
MFEILHEVGGIECEALVATGVEFQAVRLSLQNLLQRLKEKGVITPEKWEEFFHQGE